MENSSKALLIAAAILIVIIIIAVGMKILGSTNESSDSAGEVGQSISKEITDASMMVQGYNIVKLPDMQINVSKNRYYQNYNFSKSNMIKLEENVKYIISFDYVILEKSADNVKLGCGIGCGTGGNSYNIDFIYSKPYSNNTIGKKSTFTYELLINDKMNNVNRFRNTNNKYLALRLARVNSAQETFKANISNITIKHKK